MQLGEPCFDKKGKSATSKMQNETVRMNKTVRHFRLVSHWSLLHQACPALVPGEDVGRPYQCLNSFPDHWKTTFPHLTLWEPGTLTIATRGNQGIHQDGVGPAAGKPDFHRRAAQLWPIMAISWMDNERTLPEKASANVNLRQTSKSQNRKELIMIFSIYLSINPFIRPSRIILLHTA